MMTPVPPSPGAADRAAMWAGWRPGSPAGGTQAVSSSSVSDGVVLTRVSIVSPDPSWSAWVLGNVGNYMADLVKYFVNLGYVRGDTIR